MLFSIAKKINEMKCLSSERKKQNKMSCESNAGEHLIHICTKSTAFGLVIVYHTKRDVAKCLCIEVHMFHWNRFKVFLANLCMCIERLLEYRVQSPT